MDFMEEKASEELKDKVSLVASVFSLISGVCLAGSEREDAPAAGAIALFIAGMGIHAHAVDVFGAVDPDTATTADCYDLLFRVTERSVPFMVEVENALSAGGVDIATPNGQRPSDLLREVLTA